MKATITFANPLWVVTWTTPMLLIGYSIGARWGHTLTAGWMLLFATVALLIHDAGMAFVLLIAAARIASAGRSS
jgi:hypothetical protein